MKKAISLLICLLLLFTICNIGAVAEDDKTLPEPDEKGVVTLVGDVGLLFDEEGASIPLSVFDYSIMLIKENVDDVLDLAISVDEENKKCSIAIAVNEASNEEFSMDLADSVVRQIASQFAWMKNYDSPSKDKLGGIWDEYSMLICVYGSMTNNIIAQGAKATTSDKISW